MIARSLAAPLIVLSFVSACGSPATAPKPVAPAPVAASSAAAPDEPSPADARVLGTYAISDEALATLQLLGTSPETIDSVRTLELSAAAAGMRLQPIGQPGIDLARSRDGTFYNEHDDIRVAFDLPATGAVDLIVVTQGPLVLTYARAH